MPTNSEEQIQIRCTKCSQRFKVGNELYGRMVECGACEHRFRVTEDTIIRHKKFYPKEKQQPTPVTYARLSGDGFGAAPAEEFQSYEEATANSRFEPTSSAKTLSGIVGGAILAILLLIFLITEQNEGLLQGMTTDKKIVLALFVSAIGGGMIVYANPRARIKAVMFSLMCAVALLLTPIYIKPGTPVSPTNGSPLSVTDDDEKKENNIEELRDEVGYAPIEKALATTLNKDRVVAVWLRDTRESNSNSVFDYLRMISQADETSQVYARMKNKSFLVLLVNSTLDLKQVAAECYRVGEVVQTVPELHLIEVKVTNSKFDERPEEVLGNPQHSAFYEMNLMELEGIDERRINQALKRLCLAPPTQSRTDIIRRMNQLLTSTDRDELFNNLAQALFLWSDGTDNTPAAMMQVVAARRASGKPIDVTPIRFLILHKQVQVLPILHEYWSKQPQKWEELYILTGKAGEEYIIPSFVDPVLANKLSSFRIASRIGTEKSIKALRVIEAGNTDQEIHEACENAIRTIAERGEN